MLWFWLALVVVSCVAALFMADRLYTYGWGAHGWAKVWLMGVFTVVAVVAGIPLIVSAYRHMVSAGSGIGVAIWAALVIALAVDALLAHEVGRACKKLSKTRSASHNGRYVP